MRVLHVTNHFYPILGYQETFLARYHSERNTVMVITSDRHSKGIFRPNKAILKARIVGPGLHKEEGLDVLRLRTLIDSDTLTVQVLAGLERAVREFAPDIIIAHEVVTVNTMRIALLRRFLRNTRIVVDDHMVYSATRGGWTAVSYQLFRIMVSPVLQRLVDRFVAVAPETREFMHKIYGIPLKRISLIPLGVDLKLLGPDDALRAEYRLKLRFEASNVVFAYVGKLIPQKGVHLFVEAAIRLLEKDRTVRFMLVGGGDELYKKKLLKRIEEAQMANAFRLLDVVPNAELRGYYNAADVGVWPLQCSISQLEASACGVPSLISDRGGAPERISFGNGLTYHESDVQDLSDKMVIFLSKEKRAVFSEKAILYSKTLDWGNLAETFLRV